MYDFHKIKNVELCYDNSRTTGYYFAKVTVSEYEPNNLNVDLPSYIGSKDYEIILNGPGVNKAIKKIRRSLYVFGIEIKLKKDDIESLFEN